MVYGRLAPFSRFPVTAGLVYPKYFDPGSGNGTRRMLGLGVAASIASDAVWELMWSAPLSIPTGTMKLELWLRTSATTGNARANPKWDGVALSANPGAATLNAEGVVTVTANSTQYAPTVSKVTLDATTLQAGEILAMNLTFETASWTLGSESVWVPWLIWE